MAQVRFFAAAEDFAGRASEERPEPDLAALRAGLAKDYPALGAILPRCAVLVAGARVGDETPLSTDVTVDVLPPFAGG